MDKFPKKNLSKPINKTTNIVRTNYQPSKLQQLEQNQVMNKKTTNSDDIVQINNGIKNINFSENQKVQIPPKNTVIRANLKDDNGNTEQYQFVVKKEKNGFFDSNSKFEMNNQEKDIIRQVITTNLKQNRITEGTKKMMNNDLQHAKEAIESGIYVNWSSKNKDGKSVDCFRLGSNHLCICNHYFASHEKILTKKKFSSKCKDCSCRGFSFIPTLPEEIGEYWIPHQKNFSYATYKVKCKCAHFWNQHDSTKFLKCKVCNCFSFNSNFCCVVCDQFWSDHENVYETEDERRMLGKPIGNDFIPFAEAPEIYKALYKKELGSDIHY